MRLKLVLAGTFRRARRFDLQDLALSLFLTGRPIKLNPTLSEVFLSLRSERLPFPFLH